MNYYLESAVAIKTHYLCQTEIGELNFHSITKVLSILEIFSIGLFYHRWRCKLVSEGTQSAVLDERSILGK